MIMATSVIKQRTIEKFIMSEFAQGNLDTQEQVACYDYLDSEEAEYVSRTAGDFVRKAIGINA